MRLYEFGDDPKLTKLIAAVDQLKLELDQGKIQHNWTLDELLKYFRKFDLVLSPEDIYNMVQQKQNGHCVHWSNISGSAMCWWNCGITVTLLMPCVTIS